MRTINDFEMMEPMKYYDNPEPKTSGLIQKRQNMIDNKDDLYIATEKHDGDWGMFIHYSKGSNLIRSRSISKVTGKYGNMTEKLPHLVEEMDKWPDNCVVLAEICWDKYGTDANTVGTILRCLPAKAVERQKENKLYGLVFDILMWDGDDLTDEPYIGRLNWLTEFDAERGYRPTYFKPTEIFWNDFAEHADEIIAAGGEGVVIQLKNNKYAPGTRTAWNTLKLKQSLPHMDLLVVDTIEPNKMYDGMMRESWEYWEREYLDGSTSKENRMTTITNFDDHTKQVYPVTKPYFMGWKNGVVVDFNGVKVSVTSGMSDEDRAWLATDAAKNAINNKELYAEVKAMAVNSQNSLRHPVLIRLRTDM